MCGVCAIGSCYCYARKASVSDWKIWLSEYWDDIKNCCDITDEDIRQNLNFAAMELDYFGTRLIPVDNFDTHSFRSGGAMALNLSGYSDTQIQKWEDGRENCSRNIFMRIWRATHEGCQGT